MLSPNADAAIAGMLIACVAALAAEAIWWIVRPATLRAAMACWMSGILLRLLVAVAGLAVSVGLLKLPATPTVVAMCIGYMALMSLETWLTLRRVRRLK